jgi:PAS domain S-box-containing protein
MKTHDTELRMIKDLLRDNPKGMKITRISSALGMNRNAAAKFLEILLMTGQVEQLEHGMSKIFILSRRTSIPTMLDRSEDLILVLDGDMKIAQVNDNYLKFAGMARESIVGLRPDAAGLPVIGRKPVFERIREAHYGTDIRAEVNEVLQGREFIFDLRLTPTVFNDGKRGITVIISDITQERRREKSLQESEANFRTLFGESPIGTAVFGSAGELLNANPAFPGVFGVKSRAGLASLNLFSVEGIPPGTKADLDAGKKVRFESAAGLPGTDRQEKTSLEFLVTPVSLTNGERQKGYLVQVHENRIRQGSATQQVPDENRRLVEEVLSCIDDPVILLDARTESIAFMNPAAGTMFGYSRDEYLGRTPCQLLGTGGAIPGWMQESIGSGVYRETLSRLQRRDGGDVPALLQMRPICDDTGRVSHIVLIIRDMTHRGEAVPAVTDADFPIPMAARRFSAGPDRYRSAT